MSLVRAEQPSGRTLNTGRVVDGQWRLVAVDVGASATRVCVRTGVEDRVLFEETQPSRHNMVGALDIAALRSVVDGAVVATNTADGDRTALAVGAAGLPDVLDAHDLAAGLAQFGADRLVVAADVVTAHIGAVGVAAGATLAAGTGVVAIATDLVDHWQRVDGWGHLLGDDGSGAWIGAAGLRAALRDIDGRPGGSVDLRTRADARFGSIQDLVRDVYVRPDRAALMAGFAPDVFDAARSGDPVASRIVQHAGEALGETAAVAAAALPGGAATVAYTGGLFDAGETLLAPLRRHLASISAAQLVPAVGTPLDGAIALARLAAADLERVPRHPYLITVIGETS